MRTDIRRKVLVFGTAALLTLAPAVAQADSPNYAWLLFHATNESRAHHDVHRLDRAFRMSRFAERHSARMAHDRRLWHTEGPGRYDAHCYSWGENVGWTDGDVSDLEKAFMASASHRRHILDRGFDRVAVGAARVDGKVWVTVFFCD
ncbi:MAG TPA: CAP domain-containing protein [Actinomycetota bacterium]